MKSRQVLIPFVSTIAIHFFVIGFFMVDWNTPAPAKTKTPQHINATLVQLEQKSKKANQKKKPKKIDLTKKKKEAAKAKKEKARVKAAKELALKKKKAEQLKQQEIAEQKQQAQKIKQQQEAQRREQERLKRQRETELQAAIAEEQQQLLEQAYAEQAASYAQIIQRKVVQRWSRPPSTRKGMVTLLNISLVPSGLVIDAVVVQSSGNAAFDRSAVQAVKKVGEFPELRDMPITLFEREFRNFKMRFNPEDVRQ